jgi:hypothetical protein
MHGKCLVLVVLPKELRWSCHFAPNHRLPPVVLTCILAPPERSSWDNQNLHFLKYSLRKSEYRLRMMQKSVVSQIPVGFVGLRPRCRGSWKHLLTFILNFSRHCYMRRGNACPRCERRNKRAADDEESWESPPEENMTTKHSIPWSLFLWSGFNSSCTYLNSTTMVLTSVVAGAWDLDPV